MKTLIVFYSLTGHAKGLAEAIAAGAVGEILEIKTAKRLPKNWFMKLFVGGHQAMKKETPALLPYDLNPQAYDMIFLCTPVWASTFAAALRSF